MGYREIELVGISVGGVGALFYAAEQPDEISRLVLLTCDPVIGMFHPAVRRTDAGLVSESFASFMPL